MTPDTPQLSGAELEALAVRCEEATEADRELDAAIYDLTPHALDYQRIGLRLEDRSRLDRYHDGWVTVYGAKGEADPYPEDLPRYTGSLDAAASQVPDGMAWTLGQNVHHRHWQASINTLDSNGVPVSLAHGGSGVVKSTPALALTAASLRARARSSDLVRSEEGA